MKLTTYLKQENIQQGVFVSSKKRTLELIGEMVVKTINPQLSPPSSDSETSPDLCPIDCFAQLFKREKLGSTAINNGVALPHAKLPPNDCVTLAEPIVVFLQLATPIDYQAQDNKGVDLIYAVLFPEKCCEDYKCYLTYIAQKLSNKLLLKQLRSAQSAEEIWQILEQADQTEIE